MTVQFNWKITPKDNVANLGSVTRGAFSIFRDPLTLDRVVERSTWKRGPVEVDVAFNVVGTIKGTFLPDPSRGLDLESVPPVNSGAPARLELAVKACLAAYTSAGLFKVEVRARQLPSGTLTCRIVVISPDGTSSEITGLQRA